MIWRRRREQAAYNENVCVRARAYGESSRFIYAKRYSRCGNSYLQNVSMSNLVCVGRLCVADRIRTASDACARTCAEPEAQRGIRAASGPKCKNIYVQPSI